MKPHSESMVNNETRPDIAEYWRILMRKKLFILVPLVLATTVAVIGVRFLSPIYESASIILMQNNEYLSREVERFAPEKDRRRVQDQETLERIRADLVSSDFLWRLIDYLGIAETPNLIARAQLELEQSGNSEGMTVEELVRRKLRSRLRKMINVSLAGPGMFRVACQDYDPETCYRIAQGVTDLYMETQRGRQIQGLQEAGEFSDEQLAVYKTRVASSEAALERLENRLANLALEDDPVVDKNLRAAETLSQQLAILISGQSDVLARTRGTLVEAGGTFPSTTEVENDAEVKDLVRRLIAARESELLTELAGMGSGGLSSSEETIEAEGALQRHLVNLVHATYKTLPDQYRPVMVEYFFQRARLSSLEAKRARLNQYMTSYKNRVEVGPQLQIQLAKAREEVATNREIYNSFLKAKTSTQISEAVQHTNLGFTINYLERPALPSGPVKPNKIKIVALAIALGAGLGFLGVFVSEYTDTSYRSCEQIEGDLQIRVLGAIPNLGTDNEWGKARGTRRMAILSVSCTLILVVAIMAFYYYDRLGESDMLRVGAPRVEAAPADNQGDINE